MFVPGVDQAVTAFLFGCVALSIAPAKGKIVAKWNPLLYAVALGVALLGGLFGGMIGISRGGSCLKCEIMLLQPIWRLGRYTSRWDVAIELSPSSRRSAYTPFLHITQVERFWLPRSERGFLDTGLFRAVIRIANRPSSVQKKCFLFYRLRNRGTKALALQ
jgi:hypothetical protein